MTNTPEITPDDTEVVEEDPSRSRRNALRALLAGGGAAAGVVAFGKSASAGEEGQPNPDNTLELGEAETNTSETATTLVHTPALPRIEGPSSLSVAGEIPSDEFPFTAQVGGYGDDNVVHGLHGSTTNPNGFGVVAANLADGPDDPDDEPPSARRPRSRSHPSPDRTSASSRLAARWPGRRRAPTSRATSIATRRARSGSRCRRRPRTSRSRSAS